MKTMRLDHMVFQVAEVSGSALRLMQAERNEGADVSTPQLDDIDFLLLLLSLDQDLH